MKFHKSHFIPGLLFILSTCTGLVGQDYDIQVIREFNVGSKVGSLRAVPVQLPANNKGILLVYSADKDIDPWIEMFYSPTDHLKFVMYDMEGKEIWRKELDDMTLTGMEMMRSGLSVTPTKTTPWVTAITNWNLWMQPPVKPPDNIPGPDQSAMRRSALPSETLSWVDMSRGSPCC